MNLGKKAVLKFYGEDRHDSVFVFAKLHEFRTQYKNILKYFISYMDYHPKVGIHVNLHIVSTNYSILRNRYTNAGEKKDPSLFLWMKDIEDYEELHSWIKYCIERDNNNWRYFLPNVPNEIDNGGVSPTSPQETQYKSICF